MRIGLNLLPVVPGIGGSWNYIANLVDALGDHDSGNEYVAFVTTASAELVPARPHFRTVLLPVRARVRALRVGFENSLFPYYSARERLDCMHHLFGTLPFFNVAPSVVTVHDLMVFTRPGDFKPVKRRYLRLMEGRAAKHATILAPVSQATADDLYRTFSVPRARVHVMRTAVPAHFKPESAERVAEFRARYGLPRDFWLCVADPYPHKNHRRLMDSVGELRRRAPAGWSLAIRGTITSDLQRLIHENGLDGRVVGIPYLKSEEMPALYSAASALVFPSLFEGGGIPVIEAMACGCPVVASDIPSVREFAGTAVRFFNPQDVASITAAMDECERSADVRASLVAAGKERAKGFRPEVLAELCRNAYGSAVALRPRRPVSRRSD